MPRLNADQAAKFERVLRYREQTMREVSAMPKPCGATDAHLIPWVVADLTLFCLDLLDANTALTARAEQAERVARAASLFFDTQHTMYVETEGATFEHFAEEAEQCGLMEWTPFDPTKHKCFGDPAPGERVFMPTELGWEVLKYRPPPADALDRAAKVGA